MKETTSIVFQQRLNPFYFHQIPEECGFRVKAEILFELGVCVQSTFPAHVFIRCARKKGTDSTRMQTREGMLLLF